MGFWKVQFEAEAVVALEKAPFATEYALVLEKTGETVSVVATSLVGSSSYQSSVVFLVPRPRVVGSLVYLGEAM